MRAWARRSVLAGIVGAALAAVLAAGPASAQNKLAVVTTTGMIADAVKQVGGDRVQVTSLMGPGVDPHTYRQTRSDISALTRADAVVWHGLYLEAQLEDFLKDLARRKPVVALADQLPKDRLLTDGGTADRYDPHVWMDPRLWKRVVEAARDALIKLEPQSEPVFRANAVRHLAEIEALADYADKAFASVPESSRILITAHDAFNYFGRAYNYEVLGIQGISTESEAGLKQIENLVGTIVARKIGAIFVESSVSDRNVKALVEGAAAKGHTVVIGGELFSDAMGAPGSYTGTYIGMIDHNVTVITRALGGKAPAQGFNNRLASAQQDSRQ
uniref:Periplasmic solute binding protein n=1 Tax=Rhodopseudomonas palustris (strain BisA53) TaxID=316055 RepID=Q07MQ7_RHOP5